MHVAEIMQTNVKTATPDATFAEVARLLHDNRISSVVVMEGDRLAGIVTEHELGLFGTVIVTRRPVVSTSVMRRLPSRSSRTSLTGVAVLLGECHACHQPAREDEYVCRHCGVVLTPRTDRQHLGLAPVRTVGVPVSQPPVVSSAPVSAGHLERIWSTRSSASPPARHQATRSRAPRRTCTSTSTPKPSCR